MREPRDLVRQLEAAHPLPSGSDERFFGYGVMACRFTSGDILCHRRFPASSVGPAYTSIWHRDPAGRWTFYQDVEPMQACTRFFGSAVASAVKASITTEWTGPRSLQLTVADVLDWQLTLAPTLMTRAMNGIGSVMPDVLWRNGAVLRVMAAVAGVALGAGKLALSGQTPNRQHFIANPLMIWVIQKARAKLNGRDLGGVAKSTEQTKLGDFWIPRTGLMAIGRAYFDVYDPAKHLAARSASG